MRFQLFSTSILIAPLLVGCGSDVPIGSGKHNATGAGGSGATGGSAGASGAAGTGARPGIGGAAGSGGTGGIGGTAGTGATGGSAGTGATGGAAGSGGSTATCPVNNSAVQRVIAAKDPRDTLLVGGSLYYSESSLADSTITRVQLPSGAPQVVASKALYPAQAEAFINVDTIVSDGTSIYWRSDDGLKIWKVPLAGGTPFNVASVTALSSGSGSGLPGALALNATHAYWAQGPNPVGSIEVEYVLWEAPLAGGTPKKLAAFQSDNNDITKTFQPVSLRADATHLYFSRTSGGATGVHSLPLAGGAVSERFGAGIWIDQNQANVFIGAASFLWRFPKPAGSVTIVSTGLDPTKFSLTSSTIALSSTDVYSGYDETIINGATAIAGCGVVLKAPQSGQAVPGTVVWEGQGRPYALSYSANALAMLNLDSKEIVVLNP